MAEQINEKWFDNQSWQPDLLIDKRPQPLEPEFTAHESQYATVDYEWPMELGGEG